MYHENSFAAAFGRLDELQSKFNAVAVVEEFRTFVGGRLALKTIHDN
jgi:hypothetical protein